MQWYKEYKFTNSRLCSNYISNLIFKTCSILAIVMARNFYIDASVMQFPFIVLTGHPIFLSLIVISLLVLHSKHKKMYGS